MKDYRIRAWNIDENRYVKPNIAFITTKGKIKHEKHIIIEQDTGLKDKNGDPIYQGDIVALTDLEDGLISFEEVVQLPCGVWYLDTVENDSLYDCVQYQDKLVDIRANIHENPELLEQKW